MKLTSAHCGVKLTLADRLVKLASSHCIVTLTSANRLVKLSPRLNRKPRDYTVKALAYIVKPMVYIARPKVYDGELGTYVLRPGE